MADKPPVNLLCHVERLPDYETRDDVYFSMNLTVAFNADPGNIGDELKPLISPWVWKIGSIDVYLQKAGVLGQKRTATRVGATADPNTAFSKELDKVRDDFIAKHPSKEFVWVAASESLQRDGKDVRWHDYLIHVSTYPPALTQAAGISLIFKINQLADYDRIVAAPWIDFGDGQSHQPADATSTDPTDTGNTLRYVDVGGKNKDKEPYFYRWEYQDSSIVTYQRECLLQLPDTNDQFLDLASGWVKSKGAETSPEDWALQLEGRLSEAFDLPLRIIDALRTSAYKVDDNNRDDIVRMVTAALHDITGSGVLRARRPKIVHDLILHIVHDLKPRVSSETITKSLVAFEGNLTSDKWHVILAAAIPTDLFKAGRVANDDVIAELLRLHGLLTDETTLRALLLAQWASAFVGDDDLSKFLEDTREQLIADVLPRFSLRKMFLFDALQESWPDVSGLEKAAKRDEQVAELKKSTTAALQTYLHERFAQNPNVYGEFKPRVNAATGVGDLVKTYIEGYVTNLAPSLVPEDRSEQDALLIQLADVVRPKTIPTTADDQNESSRRISGYGVLLRRTTDSEWRCLNLAKVFSDSDDETPLVEYPLPVPLRLGFRNGVRQTFVAYDNAPLVAESPFIGALSDRQRTLDDALDPKAYGPIFRYRNPYGPDAKPKLVPLVYGESYEAAAFAFGVGGSLPNGLAKVTANGMGKTIEPTVMDLVNAKPQEKRTLKFRRRLPVGAPRAFDPKHSGTSAFETLAVHPIPHTVLPLARSVASKDDLKASGMSVSRPLLLLRTDDRRFASFEFALQPPSVDIHTWDRWVAKDPNARKFRIGVWRDYHDLADEAGTQLRPGDARADLSLDDPAVSSWVVRLTRRFPLPAVTLTDVPSGPMDKLTGDTIEDARHKPLTVSIEVRKGLSAPLPPSVTPTSCKVVIPDGQVWTLDVFPAVDNTDFKNRFATDVQNCGVSGSTTLFQPFTLDIEATPAEIKIPPKELFDALQLPHTFRDDLVVTIDGAKLKTAGPWIHRVEVVIQQWRWSGRPIFRPRMLGNGQFDDLVEGFFGPGDPNENDDAVLFADRSPIDALVAPAMVDFVATPPTGPLEIHRRDLRMSKGALYFRVALRAFSRYEGLIVGGDAGNDSRKATTPEAWCRRLVRCRWTAEIPRPVVKLIVPLTRPLGEQQTPALLAVLDEPWGETGGLAEKLTAEIVSVARTDHEKVIAALPNDTSLLELGPDPIINMTRNTKLPTARPLIGPIGYTFDTDTDAPLYVKTSFIVPPPDGIDDLSWYFVKLCFRRELESEWTVPRTDYRSGPTQPVWAQFLPPATRFGAFAIDDLHIQIDNGKGSIRSKDGNVAPLEPTSAAADGTCVFELYVVLTNHIEDASGRPEQEAYLEVAELTQGLFAVTTKPTAPRARVIEVQRRKGEGSKSLWDDLFGGAAATDAPARIVRVSPPIEPT